MPTWKRVILDGDQQNLAEANLTQSDTTRTYKLNSSASSSLTFQSNAGDSLLLLSPALITIGGASYTPPIIIQTDDQKITLSDLTSGDTEFDVTRARFDCTNADSFEVRHTNSGVDGPRLDLTHTSSSPADDDTLGSIRFKGKTSNSGSGEVVYSVVNAKALDVTDSTKDSDIKLNIRENNVFKSALTAKPRNAYDDHLSGIEFHGQEVRTLVTPAYLTYYSDTFTSQDSSPSSKSMVACGSTSGSKYTVLRDCWCTGLGAFFTRSNSNNTMSSFKFILRVNGNLENEVTATSTSDTTGDNGATYTGTFGNASTAKALSAGDVVEIVMLLQGSGSGTLSVANMTAFLELAYKV